MVLMADQQVEVLALVVSVEALEAPHSLLLAPSVSHIERTWEGRGAAWAYSNLRNIEARHPWRHLVTIKADSSKVNEAQLMGRVVRSWTTCPTQERASTTKRTFPCGLNVRLRASAWFISGGEFSSRIGLSRSHSAWYSSASFVQLKSSSCTWVLVCVAPTLIA